MLEFVGAGIGDGKCVRRCAFFYKALDDAAGHLTSANKGDGWVVHVFCGGFVALSVPAMP